VNVYCDGELAAGREACDDPDFIETCFKSEHPVARMPVGCMKRNATLGIFEPCAMMADQSAQGRGDSKVWASGKKVGYQGSFSEMNQNYTRAPPNGKIYARASKQEVLNEVQAVPTKEFGTSMGFSRLRYKQRHQYFDYYFK
jgi:hypothetical protein